MASKVPNQVPRYLHLPAQLLWFTAEDLAIIMLCYLAWMIVSSWLIVPVCVGIPYAFMKIKASQPRGYLKHLMAQYGFGKLKGYPPPATLRYEE